MEQGARWILFVAHWIAGLDSAVTAIPAPGPWVLTMLTLGAIWLILWRGWVRWLGVAPVLLAFGLWGIAERPLLLVSGDGKLVGLAGPEGRALSAARGGGFAAESWLENDVDLAGQKLAAGRPGFTGPRGERWFQIGGLKAVVLSGKGAATALAPACASGALVILAEVAGDAPAGCRLIDVATLRDTGPLAIWPDANAFRIVPTRTARRLWSTPGGPFTLPVLGAETPAMARVDQ
jgi:competence protein ComEC